LAIQYLDRLKDIATRKNKPVGQVGMQDLIDSGMDPMEAMRAVSTGAQTQMDAKFGPTGVLNMPKLTRAPMTAADQARSAGFVGMSLAKGEISPNQMSANIQKFGLNPIQDFGANPVAGVYTPTAQTMTGGNETATAPVVRPMAASGSLGANPAPTAQAFNFNPSRTVDPNDANRLAGQRAMMQINPQIQAKEQQKQLAMQGLEMLKQRLQQGVGFTRDSVLKEAPKLVDQQRRLRAAQGLSESGFIAADQKQIQSNALDRIAQAASQAQLQESQAGEQVMLGNAGIDSEISSLRGLASQDAQGNFTGAMVDTLQQEILDKNAEFNMRERQIKFAEYQAQRDFDLNRWKAQEAIRQGDQQLALQYQQMADTNARHLQSLSMEQARLNEDVRQFSAGQPLRDVQTDKFRTDLDQSKTLFPLEQKIQQLKAQEGQLALEAAQLQNTIMNDPSIGARAEATMKLQEKQAQIQRVKAETAQALAQADYYKNRPPAGTKTLKYTPEAVQSVLESSGVTSLGNTTNEEKFIEWMMKADELIKSGESIEQMMLELPSQYNQLRLDGVDPSAFFNWLASKAQFENDVPQ
jgi:hypothetical protein